MSKSVPEPRAPSTMQPLGDPIGQASKFVVSLFVDTALWDTIDERRVPEKKYFGPRAIKYGGWFQSCSEFSYVCINDLSERRRGAICVYDCTNEKGAVGGRFSADDVENWIKKVPYRRTDKTYHPNIAETIMQAKNIEAAFVKESVRTNKLVQPFQREQGTTVTFVDTSSEGTVIDQPQVKIMATSWLPNENFNNEGSSLDGYPLFINNEPFELLWSYKDNT